MIRDALDAALGLQEVVDAEGGASPLAFEEFPVLLEGEVYTLVT